MLYDLRCKVGAVDRYWVGSINANGTGRRVFARARETNVTGLFKASGEGFRTDHKKAAAEAAALFVCDYTSLIVLFFRAQTL